MKKSTKAIITSLITLVIGLVDDIITIKFKFLCHNGFIFLNYSGNIETIEKKFKNRGNFFFKFFPARQKVIVFQ